MAVKTVGSMASDGNMFDDTNPADVGAAAPGTAIIAARRDHVHGGGGGAWDGDIADIDLDGGTDIGAALADADLILVDDGAGGTNRKAAMSRVKTYIGVPTLTYNATTVTDADVTAASGNFYDCTIAGLTADRDFDLPDPTAAGEEVALRILDGDATYELIVKANNVEITRLFIAGEYLKLKSYGAGAGDWAIEIDGRKPCMGAMTRNAAQTVATGSTDKIAFDTQVTDIGDIVDVSVNDRIDIRRAGNYDILGFIMFTVADKNYGQSRIHVDGTSILSVTDYVSASAETGVYVSAPVFGYPLTAGQTVELYTKHNYGADRDTSTSAGNRPLLSIKEIL